MATVIADERNIGVSPPRAPAPQKKRSLFKYILFGLVGIIGLLAIVIPVLVVVIAMQPSDFRVQRTMSMSAPASAIFEQVNDFHKWEAWSPWAKMDPNAKNSFEGPSTGEGSIFRWDGNSDVGAGSMTILESEPNERVHIKLDFIRPFAGTSDVEFTLKPDGDQTAVNWSMAGKNNFVAKAISLVMDCEKMVGDQYELGLANMKAIVEKPATN